MKVGCPKACWRYSDITLHRQKCGQPRLDRVKMCSFRVDCDGMRNRGNGRVVVVEFRGRLIGGLQADVLAVHER